MGDFIAPVEVVAESFSVRKGSRKQRTVSGLVKPAHSPFWVQLFGGCFMETLEFVIYPDGRVKETVTGIIGTSCSEVTAAIEAQLGQVVAHGKSSEFYAQPVQVDSTARSHVSESRW